MKKKYLFSYGSMKKGFRYHDRLRLDKLIGSAITKDKYLMHPAESFNYPYLLEDIKEWQIHGELYELTKSNIKDIDTFEGSPHYYYRKEVEIIYKNKVYDSFIYFRTAANSTGMDIDIKLNNWSKEFEQVGFKSDAYLEALRIALELNRNIL